MRTRTIAGAFVGAIVGFSVVFLVGRALWGGDDSDRPQVGAGEVSVADVRGAPRGHSVVVRGYVFIDSTDRVLICSERRRGRVPSCAGEAIIATGLDQNRLDLVTGTTPSGQTLRWSRDAVALQGQWTVTLAVTDVLR